MKIAIGLDIGGTNTELAWVNSKGEILKHLKLKTKNFPKPEQLVENVGNAILEGNNEFSSDKILGLGIGAPNGNYYNGSIEFAPNLGWKGIIYLAELFKQKIKLPTKLTNDANAAAYAEMLYGGAKNMQNFLVVTLGTGLGSGIIVNGEMLYGSTGFAGELGHTVVDYNGRTCGCGRKGCLETYASAIGIVRTVNDYLATTKESSTLKKLTNIESKDIFLAAMQNDNIAIKSINYTGEILGKHLSDYVALFSPEAIFLTGGLAKAHQLLIPPTQKAMNKQMLNIFQNTVKILPSQLINQNAGLLGAAAMIMK